ncbi:hypothetical protein SISSUDRAFT_1036979 [Sistotremastrum suecicum HHB10207 ss-3]|uniref:Uncharacterized protein n=1 Tax=Sistotremastrum suecicum HHB10207 ss-3 TaxID=1314776 RepID=A0A165YS40_9AGAM|nr:hypothetical protein SISSUDRAFT_1036979 [Sistotremastrum suecicum HHB10207 ss-3]
MSTSELPGHIASTQLSPLAKLPTELVIYILELAATSSKPTAAALARTCKLLRQIIEPILYRTVVLHNQHQNELFARTLAEKDPQFFKENMRRFAPAPTKGSPAAMSMGPSIAEAGGVQDHHRAHGTGYHAAHGHHANHGHHGGWRWQALGGVRALMMSAACRLTDDDTGHARPNEVAIRGFVKPAFFAYPAFASVTHLLICDVPWLYTSVLQQLGEALPYLPALTHLACPYSNKWRGDDHDSLAQISLLLGLPTGSPLPPPERRPTLKMLIISVFHFGEPDLERESPLWAQVASLADDSRLFLQPGEAFSVAKWEAATTGGEDVWEEARRQAEGWRSWVR